MQWRAGAALTVAILFVVGWTPLPASAAVGSIGTTPALPLGVRVTGDAPVPIDGTAPRIEGGPYVITATVQQRLWTQIDYRAETPRNGRVVINVGATGLRPLRNGQRVDLVVRLNHALPVRYRSVTANGTAMFDLDLDPAWVGFGVRLEAAPPNPALPPPHRSCSPTRIVK